MHRLFDSAVQNDAFFLDYTVQNDAFFLGYTVQNDALSLTGRCFCAMINRMEGMDYAKKKNVSVLAELESP